MEPNSDWWAPPWWQEISCKSSSQQLELRLSSAWRNTDSSSSLQNKQRSPQTTTIGFGLCVSWMTRNANSSKAALPKRNLWIGVKTSDAQRHRLSHSARTVLQCSLWVVSVSFVIGSCTTTQTTNTRYKVSVGTVSPALNASSYCPASALHQSLSSSWKPWAIYNLPLPEPWTAGSVIICAHGHWNSGLHEDVDERKTQCECDGVKRFEVARLVRATLLVNSSVTVGQ